MFLSSLNYSDMSYHLVGHQVHADGEIWSATSFDLRQATPHRVLVHIIVIHAIVLHVHTGHCAATREFRDDVVVERVERGPAYTA